MSKLSRAGYGRYVVVGGPANGTLIERSTNDRCDPCRRWTAVEGPMAFRCGNSGFTLRGLVRRLEQEASPGPKSDS